jgi:lipoprotein NlpD
MIAPAPAIAVTTRRQCPGAMMWLLLAAALAGLAGCATDSGSPAPVEARTVPVDADVPRPGSYRVIAGDTLYSIAWRYQLDVADLAAWNGIAPPYLIYPGEDLRLHGPAVAQSPQPAPSLQPPPAPHPRPVASSPAVAAAPPAARPAHVTSPPVQRARGPAPARGALHWAWPTRGKLVQTFVPGDRTRQGIRIAGRLGQPIDAAEAGRVVYSGSGLPGYGQLIIIKHHNNYLSAYGFNRKILVHDGERVTRGEQVAEMGRSADGTPLLHFEIRRSDKALDPLRLLPSR